MRIGRVAVCCVAVLLASSVFARAEQSWPDQSAVTFLAGEFAWFGEALRVAKQLNYQQGLKILPIQGEGCIESAADLVQIPQVDVALLTTDCVQYAEAQGLLPDAANKLAFISRVAALPIVVVTRRDIPNLTGLAGMRIATGPAHSATFAAGELIFGGLGLPFSRVPKAGAKAIELLRTNAADAVLLIGTMDLDGSLDPQRFHVLGLSAPADLSNTYQPAIVKSANLKGLTEGDIETVSTSLVLAALKSFSKSEKLKLFSSLYFATQVEANRTAEIVADVEGWQRHSAATEALKNLNTENENNVQQGDGP